MTKGEELEKRIVQISDDINNFLMGECIKHSYLAAEIYVAVQHYLRRLKHVLGPEKVKQIDSIFQLVDANPKTETLN